MASDHTCKTCKYIDDVQMVCRRYPPTVLVEEQIAINHYGDKYTTQCATSRFVEVNNTDWCGEYVPK